MRAGVGAADEVCRPACRGGRGESVFEGEGEGVTVGGGGSEGVPRNQAHFRVRQKTPSRAARKAGEGDGTLPAAGTTAGGTHAAAQAAVGEKYGEGTAPDDNEEANKQRAGGEQ